MTRPTPTLTIGPAALKATHLQGSQTERNRIVALGEVEYMHQRRAKAVHWIIGHLKRFLSLTAQRIFYFWFPKMKRPAQTLLRALATLPDFTIHYGMFLEKPVWMKLVTPLPDGTDKVKVFKSIELVSIILRFFPAHLLPQLRASACNLALGE